MKFQINHWKIWLTELSSVYTSNGRTRLHCVFSHFRKIFSIIIEILYVHDNDPPSLLILVPFKNLNRTRNFENLDDEKRYRKCSDNVRKKIKIDAKARSINRSSGDSKWSCLTIRQKKNFPKFPVFSKWRQSELFHRMCNPSSGFMTSGVVFFRASPLIRWRPAKLRRSFVFRPVSKEGANLVPCGVFVSFTEIRKQAGPKERTRDHDGDYFSLIQRRSRRRARSWKKESRVSLEIRRIPGCND